MLLSVGGREEAAVSPPASSLPPTDANTSPIRVPLPTPISISLLPPNTYSAMISVNRQQHRKAGVLSWDMGSVLFFILMLIQHF